MPIQMNDPTRFWFTAAMRCMDTCWSEKAEPSGSYPPLRRDVRGTAWYALGLLMRDEPGDRVRAVQALEFVLANQWTNPARPEVGCYARHPAEFIDKADLEENKEYDPNWREFIAPALILAVDHYAERLPPPLAGRMIESVRLAALGAHRRSVWFRYTNIALLSAYLLHDAGHRFHEQEWLSHGDALAREIHADFAAHSAFPEYNSPTYNGVQLTALALWRRQGRTPELRAMGAGMDAALWRDMAAVYHPELRNLCGPWSRSYGTDMTRYLAATGLWIATAVAPERTPLPDLTIPFSHMHDITLMPMVAFLAAPLEPATLALLTQGEGERMFTKRIGSDPERTVTAWLSRELMIGGEASGPRGTVYSMCGQSFPATIHWRHQGELGCVALPGLSPVDAVVRRNELRIRWYPREGRQVEDVMFQISGVTALPAMIRNDAWNLPGLTLGIQSGIGAPIVERKGQVLEVRYQFAARSADGATMSLRCRHTTA